MSVAPTILIQQSMLLSALSLEQGATTTCTASDELFSYSAAL